MPIWYEGLEERQAKMRKKIPDLAWDDQEDSEFVDVEEITEESNANWKTSKDKEKHSEISEGSIDNLETVDRSRALTGNLQDNANWETSKDKEKHSEISEGGIENLETVDRSGALTGNLQELPDELILKVLSYSKPKDLISSGQVSKRLRSISYDNSLWQRVNLSGKLVKTELLELILNKGCKSLDLSYSKILPSELIFKVLTYSESKDLVCSDQVPKKSITISWDIKPQFRELYLEGCYNEDKDDNGLCRSVKNVEVLEELLATCYSLEKLEIQNWKITPKVAASVCQNNKTLQTLNLTWCESWCDADGPIYLKIIKCCQELKEIMLPSSFYGDNGLEILAKNISPNVEILDLRYLDVTDNHVRILISRCKKIKVLDLGGTLITDDSLRNIGEKLNTTLEELSLGCIDEDYDDNRDKNISFTDLHHLKCMTRLKRLNLGFEHKSLKEDEIENFRHQLPCITEIYIYGGQSLLHLSGMGGTQLTV